MRKLTAADKSQSECEMIVKDTNSMPWVMRPNVHLNALIPIKMLLEDAETGVSVWKGKYPAGFMNIAHTHHCAHGIYVLDGLLVTHDGSYGPGCFVWFPEGLVMAHGAQQNVDVEYLFITNKKIDIQYVHLAAASSESSNAASSAIETIEPRR